MEESPGSTIAVIRTKQGTQHPGLFIGHGRHDLVKGFSPAINLLNFRILIGDRAESNKSANFLTHPYHQPFYGPP